MSPGIFSDDEGLKGNTRIHQISLNDSLNNRDLKHIGVFEAKLIGLNNNLNNWGLKRAFPAHWYGICLNNVLNNRGSNPDYDLCGTTRLS